MFIGNRLGNDKQTHVKAHSWSSYLGMNDSLYLLVIHSIDTFSQKAHNNTPI